ncbi:MAG TPA: MoaD/ThiS family protein [Methanoregula sp.]|nr:MoaD/ThiS family protein [Methanoregula sp.]
MTGTQDRISITVKSFATLREVMDSQITIDIVAGSTIRTLLVELSLRYNGLNDLLFSRPGVLKDLVNILKNGRNIQYLAGLDTPLDNGDLIALFPPAAGG